MITLYKISVTIGLIAGLASIASALTASRYNPVSAQFAGMAVVLVIISFIGLATAAVALVVAKIQAQVRL